MMFRKNAVRAVVAASALAVFGCSDSPTPSEPEITGSSPALARSAGQDRLAGTFASTSRDILSLPGTVFADHDEVRGKLVFGVENANAIQGIERSLLARGLTPDEFVVQVTEPVYQLATLRDVFRPTQAGIQIHFGGYLCTMGFNVDHSGGRSFITNSHCTNTQGGTEGTTYRQPLSTVDPTIIATEAADPVYVPGGNCSAGKVCRYSDASRALYGGTASSRGVIAKTTGVNTGSLTTAGFFSITEQNNTSTSYSGAVNKVGRTTGWTQGTATSTCATVNVSGSNVQLFCQTFVQNNSAAIVGPGDSGSGVFQIISGDNVRLIGILWGGSGSSVFVFSPLKNIQDELGSVTATIGTATPPPPPPPPPPSGSDANFTKSCSGLTCTFNASSSVGATSYAWNFGDATTGSGVIVSHTFAPRRNYTVTLNTEPSGTLSTASLSVNCNPKKCQ